MRFHPILVICIFFQIIQGCVTVNTYPISSLSREDKGCLTWLENIETTVEQNDIQDPETVAIKGFPQLRANRFLVSFSKDINSNASYAAWLEQMRQLDAKSKKRRLENLPQSERTRILKTLPTGSNLDQALEECGKRLNDYTENTPEHKALILKNVQVPDAYQDWKRVIGLYPLTRYFAEFGIKRLHRNLSISFNTPVMQIPVKGNLIRYHPAIGTPQSPRQIADILHSAYKNGNPLHIPQLTHEQLQSLFEYFSPVWEIDTLTNNDRLGAVGLNINHAPQIDVTRPLAYTASGYTRWHGKVLLQLIYQVWFPAREKTGLFDLYGGDLDSIIWRVTLNPDGSPLAFDSIHACGCYYLLFPVQGYGAMTPKDDAEPVLSPKNIAADSSGYRITLKLEGRTHYLQQVYLADASSNEKDPIYWLVELDGLRSLPALDGTKRSLYDKEGLIGASARLERFLFWPFGVVSPGAMRELGTHAIAFIGKRHFDDPFLFEQLIEKIK